MYIYNNIKEVRKGYKDEVALLKKVISNANQTIKLSNIKLRGTQADYHHEDVNIHTSGSADCKICQKHLRRYCPISPTLKCNYEQEDGDYDEDCCRYCGQSEERKQFIVTNMVTSGGRNLRFDFKVTLNIQRKIRRSYYGKRRNRKKVYIYWFR